MNRRFILFAILTAACLLFTSCGGLFTSPVTQTSSDKTTSIRIPLPSKTQRTVMDPTAPNTPLELCDSYEFILKSTTSQYTATADADDTYAEFPAIPYGTYTMTAKAYGKLSDGKNAVIANFSQNNIIVKNASVTITVKFTLTEEARSYLYGYTGTPVTNNDGSVTQPTYADPEGKTVLSEKTVSSDGRTETEVSYAIDLETGENVTDAQGNPLVSKEVIKETLSSGTEKTTTTEYSLDEASEGCSKRITVEEDNKTTVMKYDDNNADAEHPVSKEVTEENKAENKTTVTTYDNSDMEHPASVTVIETNETTTTTYDPQDKESENVATIVIEITAGQEKGKKTIQKHDTKADGNPMTEETVISADKTAVVSSNFTTAGGSTIPTKETYYAAGYDYENPDSNDNKLLINKEVSYKVTDGAISGKTETTYDYDDKLTTAKDFDGSTSIIPVEQTVEKIYTTSNGTDVLSSTITTGYEYTDGKKSKVVVTETSAGSTTPDKTTTTEYSLTQGNNGCAMRVTIAEGNTTTVSRYAENADEPETPVEKDVTTVEDDVTTTKFFTNGYMEKPTKKVEEESTRTTTTEYVAGSDKTNKVTEIITSGNNVGQKTETEYDTSGAKSVPSVETVTSPDDHKTISTFDYPTANTEKKTTYQTDWDPGTGTEANPNNYHVAKTVEQAFNADGTVKSTTTSEFDYTDTALSIIHYDQYNNPVIPYDSTEVTVEENGSTITTKTIYTYCDGDVKSTNPLGRQASKTIEVTVNGVTTTTTETYTYDNKGRIIKEESTAPGYVTKEWGYEQKSIVVYDRGTSMKEYTAYSEADILFTIPKNDENAMRVAKDSAVDEATVLRFLTNNYVLCGDTEDNLNWVKTDKYGNDDSTYLRSKTIKGASASLYNYIYKVNHSSFATSKPGCMNVKVVGDTAYVIVHNAKPGSTTSTDTCTNFWNSLDSWKYKDPETGTIINYGANGTGSGVGGN